MSARLTERKRTIAAVDDRVSPDPMLDVEELRVRHQRLKPGATSASRRDDRPYLWTVLTGGSALAPSGDGRSTDTVNGAREARHFSNLSRAAALVDDPDQYLWRRARLRHRRIHSSITRSN
ncbi:hypothetical protein [Ensifer sp. B1-9]|uniref:hypothetical protein n=1 Tax=Ensifer sp. B1-9 TaxID=3141455 RepID=UPI003D214AFA